MNYYFSCFRKYASFSGRASRSEYWYFILFNLIFSFVIGFIDGFIGAGSVLSGLYILIALIPGLAVLVRRLHDTGKSGGNALLLLIPLIGIIIMLVFLAQDSDPTENRYGPNPK